MFIKYEFEYLSCNNLNYSNDISRIKRINDMKRLSKMNNSLLPGNQNKFFR